LCSGSFTARKEEIFIPAFIVKTGDWDITNSKVFIHGKQAATINKNPELTNYKAMQVFDELKISGVPFTIDELTGKLKGKEERPLLFIEYLTSGNEELRRKAGLI
jgi:hypothetical protein